MLFRTWGITELYSPYILFEAPVGPCHGSNLSKASHCKSLVARFFMTEVPMGKFLYEYFHFSCKYNFINVANSTFQSPEVLDLQCLYQHLVKHSIANNENCYMCVIHFWKRLLKSND